MDILTKEYIDKLIETAVTLAYLGVETEDPYYQYDKYGFAEYVIYKFTIPEKSTISEIVNDYKTDDMEDLKKYVKDILIESIQQGLDDDEKEGVVDFVRFYAKVRTGDIWDTEKGEQAVKKIKKAVLNATNWEKV